MAKARSAPDLRTNDLETNDLETTVLKTPDLKTKVFFIGEKPAGLSVRR